MFWSALPGVCDMERAFGVTKVLKDWCLVGLLGVCDKEWAFCVTKVLCEWGMRWVLMGWCGSGVEVMG